MELNGHLCTSRQNAVSRSVGLWFWFVGTPSQRSSTREFCPEQGTPPYALRSSSSSQDFGPEGGSLPRATAAASGGVAPPFGKPGDMVPAAHLGSNGTSVR